MLKSKLLSATAAAPEPVFIEDVFSTYLYTGNSSTQTITNGIDLAGEGGLVWIKSRNYTYNNNLFDSERGTMSARYVLESNSTSAQGTGTFNVTTFNSDGFSLGAGSQVNGSSYNYASWTFRKAPRFFDVVTWTGTGSDQTISHNLGVSPGCIIVKRTNSTGDWYVYHRNLTTATENWIRLNNIGAANGPVGQDLWGPPSDTTFKADTYLGLSTSGATYVAYLFAHDPTEDFRDDIQEYYANGTNISGFYGTGEYRIYVNNSLGNTYYTAGTSSGQVTGLNKFAEIEALIYANTGQLVRTGPLKASGTVNFYSIVTQSAPVEGNPDGLIACGSYTNDGSGNAAINIGWEPQFVILKNASGTSSWLMYDNMRGMPVGTGDKMLAANTSSAEIDSDIVDPTATGFNVISSTPSATYIYIAIRRGPMREPTSGTEVFAMDSWSSGVPSWTSGFPVDYGITKSTASSSWFHSDRLRGAVYLMSNSTNAETSSSFAKFDIQNGWGDLGADSTYKSWMFRRAPGFFDVVAYRGVGGGQTVNHNLGVEPEMIWIKVRDFAEPWSVGHIGQNGGVNPWQYWLKLNDVDPEEDNASTFNDTPPTSNQFTVGNDRRVDFSGLNYIAYLFATLPGISKVGSYTGNGSSQTINCGFTGGARFILIKRTNSTGDWYVWDTARGIVSGNDPHLSLNTAAAGVTTDDSIDPDSSGFIVNQVAATNVNVSSARYIYLAIA